MALVPNTITVNRYGGGECVSLAPDMGGVSLLVMQPTYCSHHCSVPHRHSQMKVTFLTQP